MISRLIDAVLTVLAVVIAGRAILGAFASWRQARRQQSWWQWGHLAMLLIFVAFTAYLIVSLGSAIAAAHS